MCSLALLVVAFVSLVSAELVAPAGADSDISQSGVRRTLARVVNLQQGVAASEGEVPGVRRKSMEPTRRLEEGLDLKISQRSVRRSHRASETIEQQSVGYRGTRGLHGEEHAEEYAGSEASKWIEPSSYIAAHEPRPNIPLNPSSYLDMDVNVRSKKQVGMAMPCEGSCASVVKAGVLFTGDSPVRRLYTRLLARVSNLTDTGSDELQNDAKFITHGPSTQMDYNHDGNRIRFSWDEGFVAETVAASIERARADGFQFVYVGFPSAHMMHNPSANNNLLACEIGSDGLKSHIQRNFRELIDLLGTKSNPNLTFGSGIPYAYGEVPCANDETGLGSERPCKRMKSKVMCGVDCKPGACDYSADNRGVERAVGVHRQSFNQLAKPDMRYFDTFKVTLASKHFADELRKKADVHFQSPVLDDQLNSLFDAMLGQRITEK